MDKKRRIKRHIRIRKKISGTSERPRLCLFRSNKNIYIQIIDDKKGKTLVSFNSLQLKKINPEIIKNKDKVIKVAEILAKKALEKGIKEVVFDRGGFSYKGRVKLLAEELRKQGLNF